MAVRAVKFKKERGRLPSTSSTDAREKRMAEGAAAFVCFRDEGRHDVDLDDLRSELDDFFDPARLDMEIKDRFGNPIIPREWFLVRTLSEQQSRLLKQSVFVAIGGLRSSSVDVTAID